MPNQTGHTSPQVSSVTEYRALTGKHDIRLAKDLLRVARYDKAIDLLYQQMTDRMLIIQYGHQKFGTRFRSNSQGETLGFFPSFSSGQTRSLELT
jgi:hypothetical protein